MNTRNIFATLLLTTLQAAAAAIMFGQEVQIGLRDSIESEVLHETRRLIIHLPKDYDFSEKAYPVLYRLDGDSDLFIETVGIVHRLAYREEAIPEVIIVAIENTNRARDMMPTNTGFYHQVPGAEKFKEFIVSELFPHMHSSYRVTEEKILSAQSLSSIFALYCFLTSPDSFDAYIASSAGFPGCEPYFINLTNEMLMSEEKKPRKIFLTHGAEDHLDPDGVIGKQLSNFEKMIASDMNIECNFRVYEGEGHVPFQSLYHGLKFVYE